MSTSSKVVYCMCRFLKISFVCSRYVVVYRVDRRTLVTLNPTGTYCSWYYLKCDEAFFSNEKPESGL